MDKKNNKNGFAIKLTKYQKEILNNYINAINSKIKVDGVLLYGSRAYGNPNKYSDVDIVVISPDFKNKNFFKRIDWLTKKRIDVADTISMDVIGYTPKEFLNIEKKSAIMAKAKKDGAWIYK